jgi:putative ABC transport system substrate-binding protein
MKLVRRRRLLFAASALFVAPFTSIAQQGRLPRIGCLISETLSGQASRIEALRAGLRELGYVEGKNIVIELRPADGNYERLPALAAELVGLKVDVLVAFGGKAVLAAKVATTTLPIVVPSSGDPVAMGLVGGLAHPGGNITGNAQFARELSAKRVELLKEALPRIARVGAVMNAANPSSRQAFDAMRAAAESSKLELREFKLRSPKEFGSVFDAMAKGHIGAVLVSQDTLFQAHAKAIADLAAERRLPSVGATAFADAGGLIGYGVDDAALYRRAAYFVDRILKGAKPADLPVERPTRFELVINMKTAKALGVKIPQTLLVRADRVIE